MLLILSLAVAALTAPVWVADDTSASQVLADIALENAAPTCDVTYRQEWHDLSKRERRDWIKAVQCLQTRPSRIEGVPGARTRYDDFVALHIQQTMTIHATGNFLSWHRYYVWAFEKALRNECGYQGFQPYVNWGKFASNPLAAPLFDGSGTSIGNNGAYRNHTGIPLGTMNGTALSFPPGLGGDCITAGPFSNTTVNLGPLAGYLPYVKRNPLPSGLGYNPQCLIRDINPVAAREASDEKVTELITTTSDIASFQNLMQGIFDKGIYGVHTAGHYLVGGYPGGDFYVSPGDPYFWLHHAMIDRVWWIWQSQGSGREDVVAGTITLNDNPPSRNATLDDEVDMGAGLLAENLKIRDLVRTTDGPFCYLYE
ncbi:Tyrosinase-like protein 2 [Elsinoe fawcettii]|nr:Tyrosinase-like protein 2 [Elsinoe fawcettii]